MKNNIAYCGLNCELCDAYIATKNNDDALRANTAKLWSELNGVEILPEHINCEGCRADGIKTYFCESLCQVRKCAEGNRYNSCGVCSSMNECGLIGSIIVNNPTVINNLKEIHEAVRI